MDTVPDITSFGEKALAFMQAEVLTLEALIQIGALAAAFVIAGLVYRMFRERLRKRISDMNVSFRVKVLLQNVRKLIFPALSLFMIFCASVIMAAEPWTLETGLNEAVMKLLGAWIVIRLALQFIRNNFIRNVFALTIWTLAALSILGVLDQTAGALDAFGMDIGQFRLSALSVVKGIFALFVLMYGALFISGFLERSINNVKDLTAASRVLLSKIVRILLVTIALVIGLTTAGIDLSLLAVFSGALGLGIGFGLQKGISNLFSGMLLLMDKSIKPGDVIELEGGTFGWVHFMGARFTEIITRDNKSYLVPNEEFITNRVVNWSHGSTLIRVEVAFGVHYNSNPHEVKRIAEEAARLPDRVVDEPQPLCHFVEFGDSSLNFKLRFWIKDAEKGVTNMRGAVMLALWDAFKENNITIPYPHREVYVREWPEETRA